MYFSLLIFPNMATRATIYTCASHDITKLLDAPVLETLSIIIAFSQFKLHSIPRPLISRFHIRAHLDDANCRRRRDSRIRVCMQLRSCMRRCITTSESTKSTTTTPVALATGQKCSIDADQRIPHNCRPSIPTRRRLAPPTRILSREKVWHHYTTWQASGGVLVGWFVPITCIPVAPDH